jgi:Family of unknown function (DUF6529)
MSQALTPRWQRGARIVGPGLLAVAVAAAIYAFGRSHPPDYSGTGLFGRTAEAALPLKSWLATAIVGLALVQLGSALWIYRKFPRLSEPPQQLKMAHRLSGVALFVTTLPVAYHCMFAYGVQTRDARVAVHSLAGCFFYGAFAAKIALVHARRLPGWLLPVAGGTLFATIVLWYTSAAWYFNGMNLPTP